MQEVVQLERFCLLTEGEIGSTSVRVLDLDFPPELSERRIRESPEFVSSSSDFHGSALLQKIHLKLLHLDPEHPHKPQCFNFVLKKKSML